jgi:hypothetical protein
MSILRPTTRYIFQYATDPSAPLGASPTKMIQLRSRLGIFTHLLRDRAVRAALFAGRARLFTIQKEP